MSVVAAIIIGVATVVGIVATLVTLPGTWLVLLAGIGVQLWQPGLYSWWTLAAAGTLCLIGEVIELVASAAGAKRAGGGRPAAIFSIVGGIVGAIAGTFLIPVPLAGTVIGAVVGAGVGALAGERGVTGRTWRESSRVAQAAAAGRLVAIVVKSALAAVVGGLLIAGALIN